MMGGACGMSGAEDNRMYVTGGKAKGREGNRKTNMFMGKYKLDLAEIGWGGVD
jgi:hypothetical protein